MYIVFTRMPGGVQIGDSSLLLCPLSVERYIIPFVSYFFRFHCEIMIAVTEEHVQRLG